MPRAETVSTPPTLGAGRRQSYSFPPLGNMIQNTQVPSTLVKGRMDGTGQNAWLTITDTGAPPNPRGATVYQGRPAVAVTSTSTTGTQFQVNFAGLQRPLAMPFQDTISPGCNFQGIDDFWCWSYSAILAFDAIPGAIIGDVGICIGTGTRAAIRDAATLFAGIEFGPTGVGTIGVIIREVDGVAPTFTGNVAGVADMTDYHKYEIRLIGPTLTAQAKAQFLIDDRVQLERNFGPASGMPPQSVAGGNCGYNPALINLKASAAGTVRMYHLSNGMTVCAAPTEAALL